MTLRRSLLADVKDAVSASKQGCKGIAADATEDIEHGVLAVEAGCKLAVHDAEEAVEATQHGCKIILQDAEEDVEHGVLAATGIPAYFLTICISLIIFIGSSVLYWGGRRLQPDTDAGHQAMAWLLFLIDMVFMTGLALNIQCVRLFWAGVPKVKQDVKDLRAYALKLLDKSTEYKDLMVEGLNALEVRVFAKALKIEEEAAVEARQAKQAADRKINTAMQTAEKTISGYMHAMEQMVDKALATVGEDAHEVTKMAVAKAREAEVAVQQHVEDVIGEVEGKLDDMVNRAIESAGQVLQEVNDKLDRMVQKVPCAFRGCARSAAQDTKSALGSKFDTMQGSVENTEELAFEAVSTAVETARKRADEKISEVSTQADAAIDSTMLKVKWGVEQGEAQAEAAVQNEEQTVEAMVNLAEQRADSAEAEAEQLVEKKLSQLEDLVKQKTALCEATLQKKWSDLQNRLCEAIDKGEKELDITIAGSERLVKGFALPVIAFEFTIVFWTTVNVYLTFTS